MREATSQGRSVTKIVDILPGIFFREAEQAFARATANAGGIREFFIELAGVKICLRAAGDTLLPRIAATLAHLEIRNQAPVDFTICCWDDEATGADLPMPTSWMLDRVSYSCLGLLTNDRFRTFYVEWVQMISCIDMESNAAYCCYADPKRLLMYEISGPLRAIFSAILHRKGMQLVHASAAGTSRGSVIFAGPPGSGKSTLAILCLQDGLSYQSDDICVLTSEQRPRSLSLYNIAKLREGALSRFQSLHPILSHYQEDEEKKAFFYVHHHFPRQVLKEAPVRALIIPHIEGRLPASRLERATPVEAAHAVISWTNREIPMSDRLGDRIMLQAVSRIPAHHLHLGQDDRQTLALIRSLLDDS
jgi:hypothetical protein